VKLWDLSCSSLTEIISSQIFVETLRPAITGENELLVQITASASSEAEGEALGADEPADEDEDVD
jgi:hypothetical protein